MPAARKVSVLQMELILSFMEEHRALARGQSLDTPQAKATVRQNWEELAATLNAVMGHQKTGSQWRDYWRDIKYRVKKKVGEQEVHKRGTGGGPPSTVVLTPVEERVLAIIGRQAVLGDEEVRIPFDEEEEIALPALPSPPSLGAEEEVYSPAVDVPLLLPAPLPRPPASQPSTSRAPPVEETPSVARSPPAKRKRASTQATGTAANPAEIPQPRWAWEAEQNRLALDQRRLEAEERKVALFERAVALFERAVALFERSVVAAAQERSVVAEESAAATLAQIETHLATALTRF